MAWANSDREQRLPGDWHRRRNTIRRRARGRCEAIVNGRRCTNAGSECDHIHNGDDHALTNLQWLCPSCHQRKTIAESKAARDARGYARRDPEPHPGMTKKETRFTSGV